MKSNSLLTFIGFLLTFSSCVRAQSEGYVEARIRFISMTQPLGGVGIVNNRKPQGLIIPTDMFGEEVTYRGPARLELVEMTASNIEPTPTPKPKLPTPKNTAEKKGAKSSQQGVTFNLTGAAPLAWIDLPQKQGLLHLIILVTPGQGNGMAMLSDKPGTYPPGSNRYLNLCPYPLTVKVPAGNYVVPAGGIQTLRPGGLDQKYYDFQLLSSEAEVLFSTRVYHLDSTRKLYVLSQIGTGKRVRLRAIVDRPSTPKGSYEDQAEKDKK